MNNNKQLAYKVWLDELKTTPSEVFFPTLKQYLELLVEENPTKIKNLLSKIEKDKKRTAHYKSKAIKELEGLLKKVKIEAKKENIQSLPEIDKYYQAKKSKILSSKLRRWRATTH